MPSEAELRAIAELESSNVSTPEPKDSPLMQAWNNWKASEGYANAVRWLNASPPNIEGELWGAFTAGYRRGGIERSGSTRAPSDQPTPEETP